MQQYFLSRLEVRDVDRRAIEEYGIPGVVLMENAGRGAVEALCRLGGRGPVVICAGKGNNGGDGFVMARHLAIRGIRFKVLLFCKPEELQGDASINYRILQRSGFAGVVVTLPMSGEWLAQELAQAEWIVDALLGTGAQGIVREPYATAIQTINEARRPVFAVDLPSGMDCDTGFALGACVRATHTVTFVAQKPGFGTLQGRELTGTVEVLEIGIPPLLIQELIGARSVV